MVPVTVDDEPDGGYPWPESEDEAPLGLNHDGDSLVVGEASLGHDGHCSVATRKAITTTYQEHHLWT